MPAIYNTIKYEIRLLLTGYKKILVGILFLSFFSFMLLAALQWAVEKGSLFESFTVGVVDNDGSTEIELLLQAFNGTESISDLVSLEKMDYEAASFKLMSDELPAFVIVPSGFTESIKTGENLSVTLVGNENRHLQLMAARLLMDGAIAFLTSSQAGIYSTINYAYEQGIAQEEINSRIVLPINIAYLKALLDYETYFHTTLLHPTGFIDLAEYYRNSGLSFLITIWLLVFIGALSLSFNKSLLMKYKFYGFSPLKAFAIKLLAFYLLLFILMSPLCYFYGARLAVLVFHFGNLGIMTAMIFRSQLSAGLFLATYGLLSIFFSGGVLPFAYLPDIFEKLAKFTYTYWFIHIQELSSVIMLVCFGLCYLSISVAVIIGRESR